MPSYLYACLFSNGAVKVGRSRRPEFRLGNHAARVSVVGVTVADRVVAECSGDALLAESALISRCADAAASRFKREWFFGLDFHLLKSWVGEIAAHGYERPKPTTSAPATPCIESEKRYVSIWKDGIHFWVDRNPDKFPLPDSAVMRWDLRPDDWHAIWPELLDHPCAVLYAPKYPGRTIEMIKAAVPMFEISPDLRPDDWQRIWPELAETKEPA